MRLHARACQLASEILELIKFGFADGALARWRTLYEISIFANFLRGRPEELSQKYLDYYLVETYFEAKEFQKNCRDLKQRPFSKAYMNKMETNFQKLKEKYGGRFCEIVRLG